MKIQEGIVGQQATEVDISMLVGELDAARFSLRTYNQGRNKDTQIYPEEAEIEFSPAVGACADKYAIGRCFLDTFLCSMN